LALIQKRGGPQVAALLRRFGVGGQQPIDELIDAVLPVAEIPRLDVLCGGGGNVGASASDRSMIQLFNPVGSGVICILHRVWLSVGAAVTLSIRPATAAITTNVTSLYQLTLVKGNQPEPSCQVRTAQGNAAGTAGLEWEMTDVDEMKEWDLGRRGNNEHEGPSAEEGRGFTIIPAADNIAVLATFLWSERLSSVRA